MSEKELVASEAPPTDNKGQGPLDLVINTKAFISCQKKNQCNNNTDATIWQQLTKG